MKRSTLRPYALLTGLLVVLTAQAPKPASLAQTIRASHWKQRVLLVAAPNAENADFKSQKALLAAHKQALAARDFLVLDVLYDQLPTADKQFLTQKMGLNPAAFAAVLIGKDGGVKEKSSQPVLPADLFGTVDKMPMRRKEMRRQ
jgi:hypothetical protein